MRVETQYCDLCKSECDELNTFKVGWFGSGVVDIEMCNKCRESAEKEISNEYKELFKITQNKRLSDEKSTGVGLFKNMINKFKSNKEVL